MPNGTEINQLIVLKYFLIIFEIFFAFQLIFLLKIKNKPTKHEKIAKNKTILAVFKLTANNVPPRTIPTTIKAPKDLTI